MKPIVIEGILQDDSPAIFRITVSAYSDYDQAVRDPKNAIPDEYQVLAIVDTGSRQCLIIPGLFSNRHFGRVPLTCEMIDSTGKYDCRGQKMSLSFSSGNTSKTIEVPVYEHRFGVRWPAGTMLIGRTLLDQVVLTYDGPGRKVTLAF